MSKEILFRALSNYDQQNYRETGAIKSLLLKPATSKARIEKKKEYSKLCIDGKGEYALDTVLVMYKGESYKLKLVVGFLLHQVLI